LRLSLTQISLLVAPLFLGGCCYFVPCHRASYIAGTVTDAVSHQPISDAAVRLYFYRTRTAHSGCFALGGADALPFEFGVSAPGYKSIVVEAISGSYWTTVVLMPENHSGTSTSKHHKISEEKYAEFSRACR
jgi:hypothetical protein